MWEVQHAASEWAFWKEVCGVAKCAAVLKVKAHLDHAEGCSQVDVEHRCPLLGVGAVYHAIPCVPCMQISCGRILVCSPDMGSS